MTQQLITGPTIRRGSSKQDYGTPLEFIHAVEKRFGELTWDLAATAENAKAPGFYTPESDSLSCNWGAFAFGNLWLNPPFADIAPWAAKCASVKDRSGFTFLLVPASVGANWFQEHLVPNAYILELAPRMTFEGCEDPYPRDLALGVFGFGIRGRGFWRWK